MTGFDNYLSGYLDRRMKNIIDEWELATRRDLTDLVHRMHTMQEDIRSIKESDRSAYERMDSMEERISRIRERAK